jgi:hypothetical protein
VTESRACDRAYLCAFDGILDGEDVSLALNRNKTMLASSHHLMITVTPRGNTLAMPPLGGTEPVEFRYVKI